MIIRTFLPTTVHFAPVTDEDKARAERLAADRDLAKNWMRERNLDLLCDMQAQLNFSGDKDDSARL